MKEIIKISGKTYLPADGAPATGLLVLLHGYGGNGKGFYSSIQKITQQFPNLAIAVPDGPFKISNNGFAWIELSFPIEEEQLWNGAQKMTSGLNAYIKSELNTLGLDRSKLILAGFSQGTIMALHAGLRSEISPIAIIGMSGFLVGTGHILEKRNDTSVYLIGGDSDAIVPPSKIAETEVFLKSNGVNVQKDILNGLSHSIDSKVIDLIVKIVRQFFPL